MPTAQVNTPYPNRIQLLLDDPEGPFNSPVLGMFDPRRDLEIFVDGQQITINNFSYDAVNSRYLMYTLAPFNLQGVIQVIHHMPLPPFVGVSNPIIYNLSVGDNPDVDAEYV
jgi:hypothetical protein